jgi:hypothetical protein
MPVQFYLTAVNFVYMHGYTWQYFERQHLSAQIKSLLTYLLTFIQALTNRSVGLNVSSSYVASTPWMFSDIQPSRNRMGLDDYGAG